MIRKDSLEYLYSLEENLVHEKHGWGCEVSIPLAVKEIESSIGDWAEFGVNRGISTRRLISLLPRRTSLYLFDSFEGLSEDWEFDTGKTYLKGHYALPEDERPEFENRQVEWHIGRFKDTIPKFVRKHSGSLAFIHIDCNLYSLARDILMNINPLVGKGTIILFDEFYNYNKNYWKEHEYKAFMEYVKRYNKRFEYLGRTNLYQVWIRIK
ncbi:MAG: class I SAM-dependent methyltransferase [Candidatus Heimdallarchaeota archaeon]|nr:class I SAM-dependent methyltransferase [Candidatus Heimdallarchaeota archaeon]